MVKIKIMKKSILSLLLLSIVLFQSCATIFAPSKKFSNVPISSNVNGYEVYVNGNFMGEDLGVVQCDPNDIIQIKKDGYDSQTTSIKGGFNAVSLFNLLDPTIIVGWIVDLSTGNTSKVKTKIINVKLKEDK